MSSDWARYQDGDEVQCRTCHEPIKKPSPAVDDANLGAHHPSCRVTRPIECDGTAEELFSDTRVVCDHGATFWNPATEHCYCYDHQEGLLGLQPITEMPKDAVKRVQERQATVR